MLTCSSVGSKPSHGCAVQIVLPSLVPPQPPTPTPRICVLRSVAPTWAHTVPLRALKHAAPHLPPISRSAIPEDTPRPPPGSSSTRPGHEPPSSLSPASPGPAPPHAQAAAPLGEPSASVSLQALAPSSDLRHTARESRWPRRLGRQPLFIARTPPPWPAPGTPPASPKAARSDWGAPCGIARRETSGTGSPVLAPGSY